MTKKERLNKIIDLITDEEISTQEELTERLNAVGCKVSQATVSRDINELTLIKVDGLNKKTKYAVVDNAQNIPEKIVNLFKQITISITAVNNFIVIKTMAGNASSAGIAIDRMYFSGVLGTVAGDDTLLVVAKSDKDADIISKSLRML